MYSRYVAIGDSQTEGLWDGDDSVGLLGFADRLAAVIDQQRPGLRYANLAVRGRRIRDVLDEQVPQALAMQPDLITVCVGMNDVTRPGRKFDRALADLDELHARLAGSGAVVATTTFPDLTRILPIGRLIAGRVQQINHEIRTAAERHGFRLVDLYNAPSMTELDTWSDDRVHGSPKGHMLFTAAAVEALGLPGGNHDWAATGPRQGPPSLRSQAYSQVLWTKNLLMPWVWRHLQGRSSGDGRGPKRPQLTALDAEERQRDRRDAVSDR
ncbi:Lysophospholipase L1 [Mycolicibacterium rutilum]|uniref:Lysophospholipase L1 n=1 Tax=Mycolicibacterium rutilum TaxID=370526 RepID=A0A1H6L4H3_MYCRU|nr:SGNH/GDSL hydrolase family protein [Mycolicibacterium rutilum]SEH79080.1 Lysophospholipase L1 [Mycolicibacterium rutilum]